jgi:hypothetical protein
MALPRRPAAHGCHALPAPFEMPRQACHRMRERVLGRFRGDNDSAVVCRLIVIFGGILGLQKGGIVYLKFGQDAVCQRVVFSQLEARQELPVGSLDFLMIFLSGPVRPPLPIDAPVVGFQSFQSCQSKRPYFCPIDADSLLLQSRPTGSSCSPPIESREMTLRTSISALYWPKCCQTNLAEVCSGSQSPDVTCPCEDDASQRRKHHHLPSRNPRRKRTLPSCTLVIDVAPNGAALGACKSDFAG